MTHINVLGSGVDSSFFAEEYGPIVVVEDSGWKRVNQGGGNRFHGEHKEEPSKPEKVFGTVAHRHVLCLRGGEGHGVLLTTAPADRRTTNSDGVTSRQPAGVNIIGVIGIHIATQFT